MNKYVLYYEVADVIRSQGGDTWTVVEDLARYFNNLYMKDVWICATPENVWWHLPYMRGTCRCVGVPTYYVPKPIQLLALLEG